MANVLKHRFVSAKANGPDASQVQPSNWNDGHAFSGGNAGDLLTRDPTDASFGAKWVAPPAAVGVWQSVPFNAANFFADSPLIWTVAAGNVSTNRYTLNGKTLTWNLWIESSTLSGGANYYIKLVLPVGVLAYNAAVPIAFARFGTTVLSCYAYAYAGQNVMFVIPQAVQNLPLGAADLKMTMIAELQ